MAAAKKVASESDRLDILILNAGIMAVPPGKTEAGHDIQLGTNHIGHFLLTKLLLPTLEKTASTTGSDVRIVTVSSEAYQLAPAIETITSTERLCAAGPWARYGASKAANVLFASELARRHPTLTSVSLHPGMVKTDLYAANNTGVARALVNTIGRFLHDVPHGALNQLWLASRAEKEELMNGGYYTPVGNLRENKWTKDIEAAKKLWGWTEGELAKSGY